MLRKFLKKRLEKAEAGADRHHPPNPAFEFSETMKLIRSWLDGESKRDQIVLLDFVLEVIREDIKTDLLSTILYSEKHFGDSWPYYLFPDTFYDEHGNEMKTYSANSMKRKIDLASDCVWVMPWRRDSLRSMILNVFKNGFKFDEDNHRAYYFAHIDICHVCGGNHSIAAGMVHKKGFVEAEVCDVSRLFDHVYTDGKKWFNSHTGVELKEVADFRIAIMYEIAKMKHRLESRAE